jgi:hypothetical protein
VHLLWAHALQLLQQLAVEAQLDQEVGLGVTRELGVEHLITERAEQRGGAIDALKEVGKARGVTRSGPMVRETPCSKWPVAEKGVMRGT